MPEATDQAKFKADMAAISKVKHQTLSEFQGKTVKTAEQEKMLPYGKDSDTFANNFQEVMQFVFNHTTFDPKNEMDQAALKALKAFGVEPGKQYNANSVPKIDSKQLAAVEEETANSNWESGA
jgi:hypothetical protein